MPDSNGRSTVLALGDSVMWGQGLSAGTSFADQVVAWLANQKSDGAVLASLARSGAILDVGPTPPPADRMSNLLYGELPRTCPGIRTQLEIARSSQGYPAYLDPDSWDPSFWVKHKQEVRTLVQAWGAGDPDLVLVDGGANDFDALQIVLPWILGGADKTCGGAVESDAAENVIAAAVAAGAEAVRERRYQLPELPPVTQSWFEQRVDRLVYQRMLPTLKRLKQAFPSSPVVVTGYYPIFTPGSLPALAKSQTGLATALLHAPAASGRRKAAAMLWALQSGLDLESAANRVVEQSRLWAAYSAQALQRAIDEVDSGYRLAIPDWGDHGALAPQPWLWSLTDLADEVVRLVLWLAGLIPSEPRGTTPSPEAVSAFDFAAGYALGATLATDDAQYRRGAAALDYYVFSGVGRADPGSTSAGGFETSIASIGHPNPLGAAAFAAAIRKSLA